MGGYLVGNSSGESSTTSQSNPLQSKTNFPTSLLCNKTRQCREKPPLLLISLDGFRADYLTVGKEQTTTLQALAKCGVHAPYMESSYPTKTFPNHYTIVTVSPKHLSFTKNDSLNKSALKMLRGLEGLLIIFFRFQIKLKTATQC